MSGPGPRGKSGGEHSGGLAATAIGLPADAPTSSPIWGPTPTVVRCRLSAMSAATLPAMPCPECEVDRAGHNRASCRTCNRYAQAVNRRTASLMKKHEPEAYERCLRRAERDVWEDLVLPTRRKVTP